MLAPVLPPVLPARPHARGPLSAWVLSAFRRGGAPAVHPTAQVADPCADDDLHLALYCCYELAYRGFGGVAPDLEWDPGLVRFRRHLEVCFEDALRMDAPQLPVGDVRRAVHELLERFDGPSLSGFMAHEGTADQLREFLIHRSAYQLKEADPHTWAIPRLVPGRRKDALIEIQADEYGLGQPGASHAQLFARSLRAAGLDDRYGAYLDRLPGSTLATCNLVTMFGLHRRLAAALVGHLAVFEMTSVTPMGRYAAAADRLGFGQEVRHFYDVHVEADGHHGALASEALLGGDLVADGLSPDEVVFGASALLRIEDRFARHLLDCWHAGRSSLR